MLRRRLNAGLMVALVLGLVGCEAAQTNITPDEARAIAKEAYIYGNPMVDSYRIMHATVVNPASPAFKAPYQALS